MSNRARFLGADVDRLSRESETWVPRQQLKTTCFCRDTGAKRTLRAQRASVKTSDNYGHRTPSQSKKRKDDRKEEADTLGASSGNYAGIYEILFVVMVNEYGMTQSFFIYIKKKGKKA